MSRFLPTTLLCPKCNCKKERADYSAKNVLRKTICDGCKIKSKEFSRIKRIESEKNRKQKPEVAKKARQKRVISGKRAAAERMDRAKNPIYKFKSGVRTTLYMSFRKNGYKKSEKTENIIGCSLNEFKEYIRRLFSPGMSFDNYGEWHIDHIIPLASANTESEVLKLSHYTNLQPLWAIDNLRKGSKQMYICHS